MTFPRHAWTAGLLAACLIAAPVHGAPAQPIPPAAHTADPALTEAQALYTAGLTHYETLDYDLAIESWKQALGRLRDADSSTPDQAASVGVARNAIVYNIARAQENAFDQDHDVARLKKAKGLLERYVEEIGAAGTLDPEDVAKANVRIDELGARIEAAEKQPAAPPPKVEPRVEPTSDKPRGRGLTGGGAAMLVAGIGLVAGGVSAGVVMTARAEDRIPELDQLADEDARRDEIARGKRGDTMLLACAISGGVLALGGVAMLAVGVTRMKNHRNAPRRPCSDPGSPASPYTDGSDATPAPVKAPSGVPYAAPAC